MSRAEARAKKQFEGKSDQYVIDVHTSCHDAVVGTECFSGKDVTLLSLSGIELERRGYEIRTRSSIEIKKVVA